MNPLLKIALVAIGSAAGFVGAFTGFSLALGAEGHEIAIIGGLFPQPPEEELAEGEGAPEPPIEPPASMRRPARKAGIGVLDVFSIESPYSSAELDDLAETLERKLREVDLRLEHVGEREARADDREQFLSERYAELQELRTDLEEWEAELRSRAAEIDRDEAARAERETQSWSRLSKLFEKGDAAEQGTRLLSYPPDEAARILHQLKPTRAQELLDNVPSDSWKDYAEAYRLLEPKPAGS
jgi:flagellar motility protein MotE (MotC chaperone)